MKRKGLSEVVTTLIFILLAIVAIGIVWFIFQGLASDATDEIDATSDCITVVNLQITSVSCAEGNYNANPIVPDTCVVGLERGVNGKTIEGVLIRVTNSSGASAVGYSNTNIEPLDSLDASVNLQSDLGGVANPAKVEVFPYFGDDTTAGRQVCPNPTDSYP